MNFQKTLDKLKIKSIERLELYFAGLPNFPRNFTRDSIISAILLQNERMLRDQLIFCSETQGKRKNFLTGEEKGKIIHEYPGFKFENNLSTTYNACDTTSRYFLGIEIYEKLSGDKEFKKIYRRQIKRAIDYIKRHLKKGGFFEDPSFSNAREYALKVTYWKDSEIVGREKGKPEYPVSYLLAHIQNMRAMKSAFFISKKIKYLEKYKLMLNFFNNNFYDSEKNRFNIALDAKGKIEAVNSDILQLLFYMNKDELTSQQLGTILELSKFLETQKGYRTLQKNLEIQDKYHSETIWPFEQALINIGAKKFGLLEIEKISKRFLKYIEKGSFPEIMVLNKKKFKSKGCDPQLWSVAAKEYFNKRTPFEDRFFP